MLPLNLSATLFAKHKTTILYAAILAVLLFLLKWLEYRLLIMQHLLEIYIGAIALLFTGLGIWLALKLAKPKVERVIVDREVIITQTIEVPVIQEVFLEIPSQPQQISEAAIADTGLSKRELEVLQLMASGLSNNEIAEGLFVSLSTVKTHVSNIYLKLDVKRRTQAVEKAKRMGLIS